MSEDYEKVQPLYFAYERIQSIASHLSEVEDQIEERAYLLALARPYLEREGTTKQTDPFLTSLLANPSRNHKQGIISEWNQFKEKL